MTKTNQSTPNSFADYKRYPPEAIFRSVEPSELSEEELWCGARLASNGRNLLSGCAMFDCFTNLVATHFNDSSEVYARRMGLSRIHLDGAIFAISGLSTSDWIDGYVMLAARQLLAARKPAIVEIAKRFGFSPAGFTKFFTARQKISPYQYRQLCLTGHAYSYQGA